ncbi:MAG: NADH-quinone oxidoreductase subunit H [Candidatus Melainabacteria bacterium]|nr:NADH-quinone oxidoreductase subunit H [Candidatus Melainabacteria bacterium]
MNNTTLQYATLFLVHIGLLLILSPFINVYIKKIKAIIQGRVGPPLLQGYYDLAKYFHKETVVSKQTSWLFLATPLIVFSTTITAGLLIPTISSKEFMISLGGIILFIYLFGLGRFFMTSAALEPGSSFCSMASSRELMFATLIEPVILLPLFIFVCIYGTNSIFEIVNQLSNKGIALYTPPYILSLIAIFIASMAEMCRVPFDNPETHYELTMIHEGMLLEYSGKQLGIMFLSSWLKQLIIISLIANLLFPWYTTPGFTFVSLFIAAVIYLLKVLAVSTIIAFVETTVAKVRLFRVRDILIAAFIMSIIALVINIYKGEGLGI